MSQVQNNQASLVASDAEKVNLYQKPRDWSELPSTVLEAIYTCLDKEDQINMSLVCKNWSSEYESPGVWKKIKYSIFSESRQEIWPDIKMARKFGCMFRSVEITGSYFIRERIGNSKEQLKLFLEAMTSSKCKLYSLKFKSIYKLSQFLTHDDVTDLVNCTIGFIQTQDTLRNVEFCNSFYKKEDAVKILSAINQYNSMNLKTLVLKGFTRVRYQAVGIPLSPQVFSISNFTNLTTLKVDYSELFEEIMQFLLDQNDFQIGSLKNLSLIDIECEGSKPAPLNGISPMVWKRLRKLCPQLRVNMDLIYTSQIRKTFSLYLVNFIPLQCLVFKLERNIYDPNLNIGTLFQQVWSCRAPDYLEFLSIVWMSPIDDISVHLIPFLQISKHLKVLQMYLRHPVIGIVPVFEFLLEHPPESLKSIFISITRVDNEDDYTDLMIMADDYIPLLQCIGLDVILLPDFYDDEEF